MPSLERFCSDESSRANIASPFATKLGGQLYECGTNGHVLVMVPVDSSTLRTDGPNIKAIVPVPGYEGREVEWRTLLDFIGIAEPLDTKCATCSDSGSIECEECEGGGTIYCTCTDCDDEHERCCKDCNGTGQLPCPRGCETPVPPARVVIHGQPFNPDTFRGFHDLHADVVTWYAGASALRPALIVARGWQACVMPVRSEGAAVRTFDGWRYVSASPLQEGVEP